MTMLKTLWTPGTRLIAAALVLAGGAIALASPALAQRDPAYAAARAAGQVGEKIDGYLRAQAANATLDEYALTAGCQAILATKPGEKYQAPDGSWQTRGAGAPQRDARCP
jgi:uncharacterized protein